MISHTDISACRAGLALKTKSPALSVPIMVPVAEHDGGRSPPLQPEAAPMPCQNFQPDAQGMTKKGNAFA